MSDLISEPVNVETKKLRQQSRAAPASGSPPGPVNVETKKLRQQWHERIDAIPESELAAAHELWVQTEIDRLFHKVAEGGAKDFAEGKLDPAHIDKAIEEFRARHPYR